MIAECYRANDIETYDAAAIHARSTTGVEIFFYTAHCVDELHEVEWVYEFEQGKVTYNANPNQPNCGQIIGYLTDGTA